MNVDVTFLFVQYIICLRKVVLVENCSYSVDGSTTFLCTVIFLMMSATIFSECSLLRLVFQYQD